jgi:hypothetical protein
MLPWGVNGLGKFASEPSRGITPALLSLTFTRTSEAGKSSWRSSLKAPCAFRERTVIQFEVRSQPANCGSFC